MILKLFLTFLKIGAVSFGGGYGMISLIRETVIANGWLSDGAFMDLIAVAESTPGPIAVNMATYIGASQGGLLGAAVATIGVTLPAFLAILLIVLLARHLLEKPAVQGFLNGVRPCVVALILATAVTMGLSVLLGITTLESGWSFSWQGSVIFGALILITVFWNKRRKKKVSPILLILLSALLGILLY